MARLCSLTPERGLVRDAPHPIVETEADTPLGGREGNFPGFPQLGAPGGGRGRVPGPAGGERLRRGVTRGPAAAQGARGEALPQSTLLRALIRPPSRGPAGTAKNRLHGHPAARAARPRPREAAPERRRWRSTGRASQPRGGQGGTPEPDPAGGTRASRRRRGLGGRCRLRPPGRGLPGGRARAHGSPRAPLLTLHSREPGRDERRGLHRRVSTLKAPPQQLRCRRAAPQETGGFGAGRLRTSGRRGQSGPEIGLLKGQARAASDLETSRRPAETAPLSLEVCGTPSSTQRYSSSPLPPPVSHGLT